MSIVSFINNHLSNLDDPELAHALDDWKYPSVNIASGGNELGFERLCWLEDNIGDDDFHIIRGTELGPTITRFFFTHSNDAMAFKLAYGYE